MFENLISALKAEKRTIVFTEGEDARILEAASRLKKDGLMDSILVGNVEAVKAAAAKGGFDIEGMEIIDPATYPEMDAMVAKMVELRKGKMSEEDCRAALSKGNYFGNIADQDGIHQAVLLQACSRFEDTSVRAFGEYDLALVSLECCNQIFKHIAFSFVFNRLYAA